MKAAHVEEKRDEKSSLQLLLFEKISHKLSAPKNMPAEIAKTLGISIHGAYRRLRGAVHLNMNELETLLRTYDISLFDTATESPADYNFTGYDLSKTAPDFIKNLEHYVTVYEQAAVDDELHLYFMGIDISPPCLHCSAPIILFLDYFRKNCFLNNHVRNHELFSLGNIPDAVQQLGDRYFDVHQRTRSTEIWSPLCLESFLHQVEYMKSLQLFATPGDVDILYNELLRIIHFKELQAMCGLKLDKNGKIIEERIPFELYNSDIFFSENTLYMHSRKVNTAILKHNLFYIQTYHSLFVENVKNTFDIMLSKSTPISGTNEKGRIAFFKKLVDRINQSRRS